MYIQYITAQDYDIDYDCTQKTKQTNKTKGGFTSLFFYLGAQTGFLMLFLAMHLPVAKQQWHHKSQSAVQAGCHSNMLVIIMYRHSVQPSSPSETFTTVTIYCNVLLLACSAMDTWEAWPCRAAWERQTRNERLKFVNKWLMFSL